MNNILLAGILSSHAIAIAQSGNGFSLSAFNNSPQSGYMVALAGHEYICEVGDDVAQAIDAYVMSNFGKLANSPWTLYFGGWWDDGKLYLDISENFVDFRKAKIAGLKRNQIAIWDVKHSNSITL